VILEKILGSKREEVAALARRASEVEAQAAAAAAPRGFASALRGGERVAVIAEFKRRSPSAGAIRSDAEPARVASAYEAGGAAALSVLTDGAHFGGSLADLATARSACSLPLLRKDFLIHPLQVIESRAAGADAVLLIVRAVGDEELSDLLAQVRLCGMDALVEVHVPAELERALSAGARIIGVNARDLTTFEVDRASSERLLARIPADRIAVAESGIAGAADVARAADAGADAVLVGSWLMRGAAEARIGELIVQRRRAAIRPAASRGAAWRE